MQTELIILIALGIIAFFTFLYFVPVNLWITAIFSGLRIELLELVFMRIRKVDPNKVVNALIVLTKAGVPAKLSSLETHVLAGGDVEKLTIALIKAKHAGVTGAFDTLAGRQLAGEDIANITYSSGETPREKLVSKIQNNLTEEQVQEVAAYVEKF